KWQGPNTIQPKTRTPHFSIGPNPSDGIIWVQGIKPGTQMHFFNQFGQLISKKNAISPGKIDLSDQPNGIYFIQFPEHNITYKLLIE
ncbi:MAG: hypothetical protein ACI9YL_000354, partial [Luteibaculaceae bacterium]